MQKDITYNQNILDQQNKELKVHKSSLMLQGETIDSQRNIIFFVLSILLIVAIYIVFRQKQNIHNKHQLLKTEAALVKAQSASIEAYESTLKVKNDFLTAINHELRTPMHGIIGALQIAQTDDLSSMQSSFNIINQSSEDMLNLIENILSYTEAQSQQCILKPEVCSLSTLLQPIYNNFLQQCCTKKLTLEWSINKDLPEYMFIDSEKLKKVLQKVIDNAVKFTEKGFVKVNISLSKASDFLPEENEEPHRSTLLIDIIDSGPGIVEAEKKHIFEAFQQQDSGFSRRYGGLGIGLALCEKLTCNLQGKIVLLDSEQGSHFQLSIPFQTPSNTEVSNHIHDIKDKWLTPPAPKLHPVELSQDKKLPILIVEDNPVNQAILQKMLITLGYKTLLANHGDEALSLLEHHTPSIIIMDLQMPVMDGFSCTQHIRARKDNKSKTPIIALTANLMGSQESRCLNAGMDAYLGKPIKLDVLQKTLEDFIPA